MDFLNLYLKGIEVTLNTNEIPLTNILQFIQNKSSKKIENVPLKWNSVKSYFGGFIDSIVTLENNAVFNDFLNLTPITQASAF